MSKKYVSMAALLFLLAAGFAPRPLQADGGDEVLAPHPMQLYPGSVPDGEDKGHRLSKDGLETVRKYFEARLKPGDRLEPFSGDGEKGFTVVYAKKTAARELKAVELRVAAKDGGQTINRAFEELSAQVKLGRHKEAEFEALRREYGSVDSSYFLTVREGGRSRGEDEAIAERAGREAHPDQDKLKAAGKRGKVSDEDKAAAKDFKKQMQELKAKGDMAGMMKLAQSRNRFQAPPPGQAEAAKMAFEDQARDTWEIWVKCLKETKAAAYGTRLVYAPGTLADGNGK